MDDTACTKCVFRAGVIISTSTDYKVVSANERHFTLFERRFVQTVRCDHRYAPTHATLDSAPIMMGAESSAEVLLCVLPGLRSTCVRRVSFIPDSRFAPAPLGYLIGGPLSTT